MASGLAIAGADLQSGEDTNFPVARHPSLRGSTEADFIQEPARHGVHYIKGERSSSIRRAISSQSLVLLTYHAFLFFTDVHSFYYFIVIELKKKKAIMARSVLKSLFLYFAFSVSARVFAAPAHQHQTEHHPRGVVLQEDQLLSNPRAAAPNAIVGGQHSRKDNTAVGKRVTNAMRIANGLPPLVPRRLCEIFHSV